MKVKERKKKKHSSCYVNSYMKTFFFFFFNVTLIRFELFFSSRGIQTLVTHWNAEQNGDYVDI